MKVWLNGRLYPGGQGLIDPADRGFTLGDGVYETMRVRGARACWLDRHLDRLARGAAILGFAIPWDRSQIAEGIAELLRANGQAAGVLRLTLSRGPAPRGLPPPLAPTPTMLMSLGPMPPAAPSPAQMLIATSTRRNEFSPLAQIKSLNTLDNILARREATDQGGDDALLLNTAGRLAESTIANLFIRKDGIWHTPPMAEGALPGIARAILLERGAAIERPLSPADLGDAQAAFLSNSLGLRAIAAIGAQRFESPDLAGLSRLLDDDLMRQGGGFAEHDRGGAIFFGR